MLTYKEALDDMLVRKKLVQAQCEDCWTVEAEMAVKALRKQVPLKPYLTKCDIRCSKCKKILKKQISDRYYPDYCSRCGQRIDWGKEKLMEEEL